jgi:hypothetical protein
MTRSLRFLACGVAAVCSLVFAGGAFAAYDPSLIVAHTNHALGRGGPVVIGIGQAANDDATAAATIYSPPGYRVTLGQAPGTQLGTLSGVAKIGALGGQQQRVTGTVRVDNPASHVANTCSPGLHEAVWILEFALMGSQFRGAIYVDRVTTGPEAAYASARMHACLPTPYLPPPQGAPAGASLLVAAFVVQGVFTSPATRGSHAWNAVFVPYTPGTATPNPPLTAQSTAFVRLPVQLGLTARRQKRGRRTFAVVTACVKEAGVAVRGIRVSVLGGRTTRRLRRVASARTNARGCATARVRVRTRTMLLVALVSELPARQAGGCRPTLAPRCSSAATAPAFDLVSPLRRIRR